MAKSTTQLLFDGNLYTASTNWNANGATGNFPMSIFNPSLSVNIVVVSILCSVQTQSSNIYCFPTTTDPNYATKPTIYPLKAGGSATAGASVTYRTTTASLPGSSPLWTPMLDTSGNYDIFVNNELGYLLPAGSNHGLTVWNTGNNTGSWAITITWKEL